jgi:hypothetical protein
MRHYENTENAEVFATPGISPKKPGNIEIASDELLFMDVRTRNVEVRERCRVF